MSDSFGCSDCCKSMIEYMKSLTRIESSYEREVDRDDAYENNGSEFNKEEAEKDIPYLKYEDIFEKQHNYYMVSSPGDGYAHIEKKTADKGDNPLNVEGWKLHVSINSKQLETAWDDIVMPALVENGVHHFKVRERFSTKEKVPGKEVVIYFESSRKDLDWETMLRNMQNKLENAHIHPNEPPVHRITNKYTVEAETPVGNGLENVYFYHVNDSVNTVKERRELEASSPFRDCDLKNKSQNANITANRL